MSGGCNSDNVKQWELHYLGGMVHSTHRAEETQSPNESTGHWVVEEIC